MIPTKVRNLPESLSTTCTICTWCHPGSVSPTGDLIRLVHSKELLSHPRACSPGRDLQWRTSHPKSASDSTLPSPGRWLRSYMARMVRAPNLGSRQKDKKDQQTCGCSWCWRCFPVVLLGKIAEIGAQDFHPNHSNQLDLFWWNWDPELSDPQPGHQEQSPGTPPCCPALPGFHPGHQKCRSAIPSSKSLGATLTSRIRFHSNTQIISNQNVLSYSDMEPKVRHAESKIQKNSSS